MIKNKPPKIAEWMLSRAVDISIRYSALGDFEEQFLLIVDERSLIHSRIWYSLQLTCIIINSAAKTQRH